MQKKLETVAVISLGCSKNLVDSEYLLGKLRASGFSIVTEPHEANIIIVNTCGFIESAKSESIETVIEMARYKDEGVCGLLIMTGCLSQRYPNELRDELFEVDMFFGVNQYDELIHELSRLAQKHPVCEDGRMLSTPPFMAYLRIADGCDNRCTYCAIPLIRGGRRSVPMDQLILEAENLAKGGVKELIVIAQDTTAYGQDIYGKSMICELLNKLTSISGIEWVRLLYTYPNTVTKELIDTIAANEKIVNYIDMPIQHISQRLLTKMNRHGTSDHIKSIVSYMRKVMPDFVLRSTAIVGFPTETEAEFQELLEFFRENTFERLGAFAYSREEDTPAYDFEGQIPDDIKEDRLKRLYEQQRLISLDFNKSRIGKIERVLVESVRDGFAYCRSYAESPDIDGYIIVPLGFEDVFAGDFINIRLIRAEEYDMIGEICCEPTE